jgi:hypothetical protein
MRRVPTASGARAVQIVHEQGRRATGIEHIGSAHTDAELALLNEIARQRLREGQQALDFPVAAPEHAEAGVAGGARVVDSRSQLLWQVLQGAYARLGFTGVGDEAFAALVLARIIEPTSKADSIRVLEELGLPAPSLRTISVPWAGVSSATTATRWPPPAWPARRPHPRAGRRWCSMTARRCTSRPTPKTTCAEWG